ncbi:MAG: hypothetical protein HYR76_05090 [Ignavibacteria bacterium]|nr:hypothetical protein [Ignavibacteria bacterium]MBI3764898.1 hypothetical protein [Ignavibacteriales bacterium]
MKFIIENIVYARSGLRGVYRGILMLTFVLTFLGVNERKKIENAIEEVRKKAIVDNVTFTTDGVEISATGNGMISLWLFIQ